MINIDTGLLIGIIGAAIGFIALKSRNNANSKLKDYERRIDQINNAEDIRNETENMGDDALNNSASQWVRDQRR